MGTGVSIADRRAILIRYERRLMIILTNMICPCKKCRKRHEITTENYCRHTLRTAFSKLLCPWAGTCHYMSCAKNHEDCVRRRWPRAAQGTHTCAFRLFFPPIQLPTLRHLPAQIHSQRIFTSARINDISVTRAH